LAAGVTAEVLIFLAEGGASATFSTEIYLMARNHGWLEIKIEHGSRVVKADYAIINRSKAVTVATLRSCRSKECANQNPEVAFACSRIASFSRQHP
jgi:hypothetical protein